MHRNVSKILSEFFSQHAPVSIAFTVFTAALAGKVQLHGLTRPQRLACSKSMV